MRIAIIGTTGVPASYGGFETLVENLVRANATQPAPFDITVYCSGSGEATYYGAKLHYLPLKANGYQSVVYDAASMLLAILSRNHVILLLGVSGAFFLPVVRLISRCRVVTNVDGIEWKRQKWGRFASWFLRLSEKIAVKFSHVVIADNREVKNYIDSFARAPSVLIPYGGDHALAPPKRTRDVENSVPGEFFFSLARIEPENNVEMILEAFANDADHCLVFVGNWAANGYGRRLFGQYSAVPNIQLLHPIYDLGVLSYLRGTAVGYIHGHSAGGTNPSLVEAMHFGRPIAAFDCGFNRATMNGRGVFFASATELRRLLQQFQSGNFGREGVALREFAQNRYVWSSVASDYFRLFQPD